MANKIDFNSPYGVDIICRDDISKNMPICSGKDNLINALYRRLRTQKGSLWYDVNYGCDLRTFLNTSGINSSFIEQSIENELLQDDRVIAVTATAEAFGYGYDPGVKITIDVTPSNNQTFTFIVGVNQLTVQLINRG